MSFAILIGFGRRPFFTKPSLRFFDPLHGPDPLSPPREVKRLSASGKIPLIAAITLSDWSPTGLSVHPLIIGIIPILILLDKALALELATRPVATKLIDGAVVAIGTGVANAPPIMTGINCVVPELTLVKVEITGCWSIGSITLLPVLVVFPMLVMG